MGRSRRLLGVGTDHNDGIVTGNGITKGLPK
jgi:hypothetical protein